MITGQTRSRRCIPRRTVADCLPRTNNQHAPTWKTGQMGGTNATPLWKTAVGAGAATALVRQRRGRRSWRRSEAARLNFVVGSKIPSYDGHVETTFGMIHPIRAVLQPADPRQSGQSRSRRRLSSATCAKVTCRRRRRRQDVHLQDPQGRQVPRRHAADRARRRKRPTNKIIFPPEGVASSRKAFFKMVDSDRGAGRRIPSSSS